MKPPITYYGGKQMLKKHIIEQIPEHNVYCEPYFGGGAVYFAKPKSNIEVINDTNGELINFYKVIKTKFNKLQKEIQTTLHSRESHLAARIIYKNPKLFDEIKRAWAIWTLANQSYASKLNGTWGYDKKENRSVKQLDTKRKNFTKKYAERLENTEIECTDAIEVIKARDSKTTFFYLDPPYIETNQGHYKGYEKEDYEELLKTLKNIKGKFLLSSYPNEILEKYKKQYKWKTKEFKIFVHVATNLTGNTRGDKKKKTEILTANFEI